MKFHNYDLLIVEVGLESNPSMSQRFWRIEWWAHLDSNQGPTGYEPVALTN